jgi:hypothetical protein
LWRDEKGELVGILNHYPVDMPLEKKGNFNIFIDPKAKRQGIATALVSEAIKRYNVDLRQQRYSREGAAFINEFVRRLPENSGEVGGKMGISQADAKRALKFGWGKSRRRQRSGFDLRDSSFWKWLYEKGGWSPEEISEFVINEAYRRQGWNIRTNRGYGTSRKPNIAEEMYSPEKIRLEIQRDLSNAQTQAGESAS